MNTNLQKLSSILLELRSASMQIGNTDPKIVMNKYDMLFLGEKFSSINSTGLLHSLKKVFQFEICKDELNALIPVACKSLNMKFDPMISLDNLDSPNHSVDCYSIDLW